MMSDLITPLTAEEITALLEPQEVVRESTQTSKFVRWFDKELRCASRGCRSPTYCKLEGVPYCTMHIIHHMDQMLNEREEGGVNMLKWETTAEPEPEDENGDDEGEGEDEE